MLANQAVGWRFWRNVTYAERQSGRQMQNRGAAVQQRHPGGFARGLHPYDSNESVRVPLNKRTHRSPPFISAQHGARLYAARQTMQPLVRSRVYDIRAPQLEHLIEF